MIAKTRMEFEINTNRNSVIAFVLFKTRLSGVNKH